MVHELVRYMKSVNMHGEKIKITQFIYFWKTALQVSGGISTHHQEHTRLCLQYLVLVKKCFAAFACNRTKTDQYNSHTTLKLVPTLSQ